MRMPTRALVALVAALLLTSCSGDPESAPPASPTPSETVASQTPEPSESATPQAETAEEFIRRWPVVETAMLNSGETAEYRAITHNCEPCDGLADQIEGFYAKGGYAKTDGWEVLNVKKVSRANRLLQYRVRIHATPTEYQRGTDSPIERLPGGPRGYDIYLKRDPAGWTLVDLADLGPE